MKLSNDRIKEIDDVVLEILQSINSFGRIDIPVDVIKAVQLQDITLEFGNFGSDDVSGIFIREEKRILVNNAEPFVRKQFTIAHELGHYILHKDKSSEILYRRDILNPLNIEDRVIETEANWFAASLLMPEEKVRFFFGLVPDHELLKEIFAISSQAMKYRLKNLGLIS